MPMVKLFLGFSSFRLSYTAMNWPGVVDEVEILGLGEDKKSVVTGVEMFRKLLDQGEAGDNVGLLLRGIDKNEIKRGMILCKPGQVKAHSKFKAEVYEKRFRGELNKCQGCAICK